MDRNSVLIQDNSKVIFQDSIDGIKTASFGKRKKLYLNHKQFSSIEGGKKHNKGMKVGISLMCNIILCAKFNSIMNL